MSDNAPSDFELMDRLKRGDESAFTLLFERHYSRVLNIVYRYLGSESEAEDIAQRVFLKIYEKANTYEPKAKFTTFLYQVVGNLCLNIRRNRARRKTYAASDYGDDEYGFDPLNNESADELSTMESMVLDERARTVRDALQQLPDNHRIALVLTHYENASHQDVADALGINANAAKQLCHRARSSLRKLLEPTFASEDDVE